MRRFLSGSAQIGDLFESPLLRLSMSRARDVLRAFGMDSVIAALTMRESKGVDKVLLAGGNIDATGAADGRNSGRKRSKS